MDALRIILIILGAAVIVAIYLWDRHQQKQELQRRIVSMPEQDDEPGIVITTRTRYDDDVSADLADLRHYMGHQEEGDATADAIASAGSYSTSDVAVGEGSGPSEEEEEGDGGAPVSPVNTATDDASYDSLAGESPEQDAPSTSGEHIVSLHIVANDDGKLRGDDIRVAAEANGFVFGEMEIYHYRPGLADTDSVPAFSLADMYEPGHFDIHHMASYSTRGISVFARFDQDNPAITGFETMLDTTRRLAAELDAVVLGPDRQPLDAGAVEAIRRRLRGEAG